MFVILIVTVSLPSMEIPPVGIGTSSFENAYCPHSGQLDMLLLFQQIFFFFLIFTPCQGLFYILWIKQ